jgi:hypothetical protein
MQAALPDLIERVLAAGDARLSEQGALALARVRTEGSWPSEYRGSAAGIGIRWRCGAAWQAMVARLIAGSAAGEADYDYEVRFDEPPGWDPEARILGVAGLDLAGIRAAVNGASARILRDRGSFVAAGTAVRSASGRLALLMGTPEGGGSPASRLGFEVFATRWIAWADGGLVPLDTGWDEGEPRFGWIVEGDLDGERRFDRIMAALGPRDEGVLPEPPRQVLLRIGDRTGVLPPIARISPDWAVYLFWAGLLTEERPDRADAWRLQRLLESAGSRCWLLNTGWIGGPESGAASCGEPMKEKFSSAMAAAAVNGALDSLMLDADPVFGFGIPASVPNVPSIFLHPRALWQNPAAYDLAALEWKRRLPPPPNWTSEPV